VVAHSREPGDSRSARRLNEPRPVAVTTGGEGVPASVEGVRVAELREEWRVVDRWWTEEPARRRYFEVLLETGRNAVVFRDEGSECWFKQQA
jgi:hypothetical protein